MSNELQTCTPQYRSSIVLDSLGQNVAHVEFRDMWLVGFAGSSPACWKTLVQRRYCRSTRQLGLKLPMTIPPQELLLNAALQ